MKVLKATQEQYEQLEGVGEKNSLIKFLKDINDNWVTSTTTKTDKNYPKEACDLLLILPEIEYEPIPQEIEL